MAIHEASKMRKDHFLNIVSNITHVCKGGRSFFSELASSSLSDLPLNASVTSMSWAITCAPKDGLKPEDHLSRFVVDTANRLDLSPIINTYAGRGSDAMMNFRGFHATLLGLNCQPLCLIKTTYGLSRSAGMFEA
jgi:hypothetical protein